MLLPKSVPLDPAPVMAADEQLRALCLYLERLDGKDEVSVGELLGRLTAIPWSENTLPQQGRALLAIARLLRLQAQAVLLTEADRRQWLEEALADFTRQGHHYASLQELLEVPQPSALPRIPSRRKGGTRGFYQQRQDSEQLRGSLQEPVESMEQVHALAHQEDLEAEIKRLLALLRKRCYLELGQAAAELPGGMPAAFLATLHAEHRLRWRTSSSHSQVQDNDEDKDQDQDKGEGFYGTVLLGPRLAMTRCFRSRAQGQRTACRRYRRRTPRKSNRP